MRPDMLRVRPVEAEPSAFGPIAQMAPAWPKLRSKERAVAAYRRAFAECEGRAAPAERGTERAAEAISLSRPRPSGAGPSGAAHHFHSRTLQAPAALAAAATLARPIRWRQSRSICRPKAAQQKSPRRGTNATSPRAFLVKASPRRRAPVLYHTFPASSIPPPTRQRAPPPWTGRAGGGSTPSHSLSTSAALRSKPPTTHAQQKIAARELTKRAGRGIITARSIISLNIRLLAQIWQNFARKCI